MKLLTIFLLLLSLSASAATPRYFLVSYSYANGTGSVGVSSTAFPAKANILALLRKNYKDTSLNIVVTNIIEFKTLDDFKAYFTGSTYFDTVQTRKATASATSTGGGSQDATGERTWYLHDLGILPNTGQCLTDQVQAAINRGLALGGKTTLILSDSGTYNYTAAEVTTNATGSVTIDTGCYPGAENVVSEIVVDKCNPVK
jgi:hypothetical protein